MLNTSKIKIIKEYIRRSGSLVFFCQTRWAKIILCQTLREGEIFSMSRESENNYKSWILKREIDSISLFISLFARVYVECNLLREFTCQTWCKTYEVRERVKYFQCPERAKIILCQTLRKKFYVKRVGENNSMSNALSENNSMSNASRGWNIFYVQRERN